MLAFHEQHLARAQKYLTKAIACTPHDPAELNNMAVLAEAQHHALHACTYYLRALGAHPGGHQVYDNIFSLINRMVVSRSVRFRTLQAAFTICDADLQKRMAAKGLIRYGATWVSSSQERAIHHITRRFLHAENSLLVHYRADRKELHHINEQGRANQKQIALLVHLTNSDAWNNPVNVERQRLFAAQIRQNKLLAARAAVLRDLVAVGRHIRHLLATRVGRIFCARPKMIPPEPGSSTETPLAHVPVSLEHLDTSPVEAYAVIVKADQQAIAKIEYAIRSDRRLGDRKDLARQTEALRIAKARLKADTTNIRGPRVQFWGAVDHAVKIVYVIDHEGRLLHDFGLVRQHLIASINRLRPTQQFAVIVFCRHDRFIGPSRLVAATARNKKRCLRLMRGVMPLGAPGGELKNFIRPFQAALELQPQTIYFLSGSGCDSALARSVKELNKRVKAHIFTYTLMRRRSKAASAIEMIARENHGQYRTLKPGNSGQ